MFVKHRRMIRFSRSSLIFDEQRQPQRCTASPTFQGLQTLQPKDLDQGNLKSKGDCYESNQIIVIIVFIIANTIDSYCIYQNSKGGQQW